MKAKSLSPRIRFKTHLLETQTLFVRIKFHGVVDAQNRFCSYFPVPRQHADRSYQTAFVAIFRARRFMNHESTPRIRSFIHSFRVLINDYNIETSPDHAHDN